VVPEVLGEVPGAFLGLVLGLGSELGLVEVPPRPEDVEDGAVMPRDARLDLVEGVGLALGVVVRAELRLGPRDRQLRPRREGRRRRRRRG